MGDIEARKAWARYAKKMHCWSNDAVPPMTNGVFDTGWQESEFQIFKAGVLAAIAQQVAVSQSATILALANNEIARMTRENFGRVPRDAWASACLAVRDAMEVAPQPPHVAVPQGWRLVPKVMPDTVLAVLADRFERSSKGACILFADIWSDLLHAAPHPPQADEQKVEPTNEELERLWGESHYGHPADFAADVLERWGGWRHGVLGYGGSLNKKQTPLQQADAPPQRQPMTCAWTPEDDDTMPGTWASACGELWTFTEGGPAENKAIYCHHCGRKIEVKP